MRLSGVVLTKIPKLDFTVKWWLQETRVLAKMVFVIVLTEEVFGGFLVLVNIS